MNIHFTSLQYMQRPMQNYPCLWIKDEILNIEDYQKICYNIHILLPYVDDNLENRGIYDTKN